MSRHSFWCKQICKQIVNFWGFFVDDLLVGKEVQRYVQKLKNDELKKEDVLKYSLENNYPFLALLD